MAIIHDLSLLPSQHLTLNLTVAQVAMLSQFFDMDTPILHTVAKVPLDLYCGKVAS